MAHGVWKKVVVLCKQNCGRKVLKHDCDLCVVCLTVNERRFQFQLPRNIIVQVVQFLKTTEALAAMTVCKSWATSTIGCRPFRQWFFLRKAHEMEQYNLELLAEQLDRESDYGTLSPRYYYGGYGSNRFDDYLYDPFYHDWD